MVISTACGYVITASGQIGTLYLVDLHYLTNSSQILKISGGPWCPKLDGEDPLNPQTLINTAIRTVKSQIGLDLSYCKKWYKIVEVLIL